MFSCQAAPAPGSIPPFLGEPCPRDGSSLPHPSPNKLLLGLRTQTPVPLRNRRAHTGWPRPLSSPGPVSRLWATLPCGWTHFPMAPPPLVWPQTHHLSYPGVLAEGSGQWQRGRSAGQDEAFPVTGAAAAGKARQGAGPQAAAQHLRELTITFPFRSLPPVSQPGVGAWECASKDCSEEEAVGDCVWERMHVMCCWCKPLVWTDHV